MPIRFRCTSCQTTLQAPDSASGKNAKCTSCGTMVRIPTPATAIPAGSKPATVVQATAIPSGNTPPQTQSATTGQSPKPSVATLKCGSCARTLRPPAGSEGKKVKCPCGAVLTIPSAGGNTPVATPAMNVQPAAIPSSQPTIHSTSSDSSWLDALPSAPTSPAAYSMPYTSPAAPPTSYTPPYSPPPSPYASGNSYSGNSASSSRSSAADMYLAQAAAQSNQEDAYVERGQSWSVDWAKVAGGVLAMVGAAAWFFGAWIFAGRIYIYPPIMFIGGLIAVVNGLFSGD